MCVCARVCVRVRACVCVVSRGSLTVFSTCGRDFSLTPQGFSVTAQLTAWRSHRLLLILLSSLSFSSVLSIFQSLLPSCLTSASVLLHFLPFSLSLMRYCGGKAYAQLAAEVWQEGMSCHQFPVSSVFSAQHNHSHGSDWILPSLLEIMSELFWNLQH